MEITLFFLRIALVLIFFFNFPGLSESELAQLEMVTLLCMGDKTHSQLMEYMPEKCGSAAQSRDFETVLSRVSALSFWFSLVGRMRVLLICWLYYNVYW